MSSLPPPCPFRTPDNQIYLTPNALRCTPDGKYGGTGLAVPGYDWRMIRTWTVNRGRHLLMTYLPHQDQVVSSREAVAIRASTSVTKRSSRTNRPPIATDPSRYLQMQVTTNGICDSLNLNFRHTKPPCFLVSWPRHMDILILK